MLTTLIQKSQYCKGVASSAPEFNNSNTNRLLPHSDTSENKRKRALFNSDNVNIADKRRRILFDDENVNIANKKRHLSFDSGDVNIANKRSRVSFDIDDIPTPTIGSSSTDVDTPCLEVAVEGDYCLKSIPSSTPQQSIVDADIPTTLPRLNSETDTIDLAERILVTPTVVNMAIPHIHSIAEHVKCVADKVFQSLEQFIVSEPQQVNGSYDPLRKLVQGRLPVNSESSGARFTHEKHLYTSIDALIHYITSTTVNMAAPHNDTYSHPRKFGTYTGRTPPPDRDQPYKWPNAAITYFDNSIPCLTSRPDHWNSLAVIEARRSDEEQADALKHLTIYSWNLYAYRLDRKFVWGFTVCDSNFRACLYSQDNVFVSDAMDVATSEGRMQLVSLLVNMSFCDASQLGYDATIRFNPAVNEWEIDVYDDERNTTDVYWVGKASQSGRTIFDKQTRMIPCLQPSPSARADIEKGSSNYIYVKDSWTSCSHLASDRDYDEVYALRRITEELGSDAELEGTFPKLLSGGVVRQQKTPDSSLSPEYTDTLFAALGEDVLESVPRRAHRRLAATPFASPISHLRSVDELIVVVADAMTAYTAIAEQCQILHRDISQNNIMFTRKSDGSVRGVLVDFDLSMSVQDSELESWKPDMRGTLPFMSIGNLTFSNLRRTALDDWESLIYLLCWLIVFGFSEKCGFRPQGITVPPIKAWQSGGIKLAANEKRATMTSFNALSASVFRHRIWERSYEALEDLICDLHDALFENKSLTSLAHGARTPIHCILKRRRKDVKWQLKQLTELGKPQPWDCNIGLDILDPFERRLRCKDKITDDLLNVIQSARSEAIARLAKNA